jgi:hypothetical protein
MHAPVYIDAIVDVALLERGAHISFLVMLKPYPDELWEDLFREQAKRIFGARAPGVLREGGSGLSCGVEDKSALRAYLEKLGKTLDMTNDRYEALASQIEKEEGEARQLVQDWLAKRS